MRQAMRNKSVTSFMIHPLDPIRANVQIYYEKNVSRTATASDNNYLPCYIPSEATDGAIDLSSRRGDAAEGLGLVVCEDVQGLERQVEAVASMINGENIDRIPVVGDLPASAAASGVPAGHGSGGADVREVREGPEGGVALGQETVRPVRAGGRGEGLVGVIVGLVVGDGDLALREGGGCEEEGDGGESGSEAHDEGRKKCQRRNDERGWARSSRVERRRTEERWGSMPPLYTARRTKVSVIRSQKQAKKTGMNAVDRMAHCFPDAVWKITMRLFCRQVAGLCEAEPADRDGNQRPTEIGPKRPHNDPQNAKRAPSDRRQAELGRMD